MPSGQFIQMLAALAQIQQGRAEIAQREKQLDLSRQQFQEGIKEKHGQDVSKAIETLMKLAPDARQAFVTMQRSGWDPGEIQMLQGIMTGQPIDQGVQAASSSQQGYAAMAPGERANIDRESAGLARTGMQRGRLAVSGAQSEALGGGSVEQMNQLYGAQMTGDMMRGAASRALTGQTPFGVATDASALSQGFAPNVARMNFQGVDTKYGPMLPVQAGQLDIGRGGNEVGMAGVNQRMMEAAAAANGQAGKIGTVSENLARMANILEQMTGRNAPDTPGRKALTGLYNTLADVSGFPHLRIDKEADIPARKGPIARILGMFGGGAQGFVPPTAQPNPMNYFAPPSGTPNLPNNQGFDPFRPSPSGIARP